MLKLEGLSWKPMWTSHIGCMAGCADYLGLGVPVSRVFGGTGHAFMVNIHEELCPSGPTAWNTEALYRLSPNIGLEQELVCGSKEEEDLHLLQEKAWELVRRSIRGGRPCYGWELEVPEFYIINGIDDAGYYISGPMCDSGKGPIPREKLGDTGIGWVEVSSCGSCEPATLEVMLLRSFQAVLAHADNSLGWIMDKYTSGPDAFRVWARAVRENRLSGWGAAYNAEVWTECRAMGLRFLEDTSLQLSSGTSGHISRLAGTYADSRECLETVRSIYPFRGPGADPVVTADDRIRSADALEKTADLETEALSVMKKAIPVLEEHSGRQ